MLAGSLVYLNSLSTPFMFDDMATIVDNEQIRRLSDLAEVLQPERERPVAGRPLVSLSFAINYAIGGLNVLGYHIGNIAVHVLCGLLLFGLVRRTLALPTLPATLSREATTLGFVTALLWTVHPLNTEVVDYLTQRTESMMALFYLLTLYASVRALGGGQTARWQVLAVVSCAAGMACKQSMVTAPLMVFLIDRLFVFDSSRHAWRARGRLYAGLAATWLLLAFLQSTGPNSRSAGFSTGVSSWTYLLNQAPMVVRYLELAVWPRSLVLLYGWPRELVLTDVLPSALFIVTLLTLTVVGLRYRPKLAFLAVWFWITLAPTSTIIPIATEVGAEKRMYLPLAGLVLLAVLGVQQLREALAARLPPTRRTAKLVSAGATILLVAVSAALGSATILRNAEYASPLAMARTILERHPTPIAHHMLANTLLEAGRRDEGVAHLRQALPGAPFAREALGVALLIDGKTDEGIAELQSFVREQPADLAIVVRARENLGKALLLQDRWQDSLDQFRAILAVLPGNPVAHRGAAEASFGQGHWDEAIVHYQAYLGGGRHDPEALHQLGVALASGGRLDEAIMAFREVVALDSGHGPAARNLARALSAPPRYDEALRHAQHAVGVQPQDAGSRYVLAHVLNGLGRFDEAQREWRRALQLDSVAAHGPRSHRDSADQ